MSPQSLNSFIASKWVRCCVCCLFIGNIQNDTSRVINSRTVFVITYKQQLLLFAFRLHDYQAMVNGLPFIDISSKFIMRSPSEAINRYLLLVLTSRSLAAVVLHLFLAGGTVKRFGISKFFLQKKVLLPSFRW